jgi:transposase
MDKDVLARWLAEGRSLEEIGRLTGRHPSTVGYWLRKHGLAAPNADRHAARGGLERALLGELCAQDLTVREIAAAVDRSPATVRHWLRRYDLETSGTARRRKSRGKVQERFEARCARHGRTTFVVRRDGGTACLRCRAERVTARRRRLKEILVEEAGGACVICGYDRCLAALEFHHRDPASKRFGLGQRGLTRSLEQLRDEASKCVLLCSNCHVEVEAEMVALP